MFGGVVRQFNETKLHYHGGIIRFIVTRRYGYAMIVDPGGGMAEDATL